jgi:hypothetical protein
VGVLENAISPFYRYVALGIALVRRGDDSIFCVYEIFLHQFGAKKTPKD